MADELPDGRQGGDPQSGNDAFNKIPSADAIRTLAKDFGVPAKYGEFKLDKTDAKDKGRSHLKSYGAGHWRRGDGLKEGALTEGTIEEDLPLERYKQAVLAEIRPHLDGGRQLAVAQHNHYVRLQAVTDEFIIKDDPGRFSHSATAPPGKKPGRWVSSSTGSRSAEAASPHRQNVVAGKIFRCDDRPRVTRPSEYRRRHEAQPDGSEREGPRPSAPPAPQDLLLSLGSAAGNRAVAGMVQRWRNAPQAGVLQRWPAELPIADAGKQTFGSMPEVFRYFVSVPPDKAKEAATALLAVLLPFTRKGPPYSAETEEEVRQAGVVQDQLGISFGEWNGLIFEAKSRLEQSDRLKAQPTTAPQQGNLKHPVEIGKVKQMLVTAGPKFNLLYDDAELDNLVEFANSVALPEAEFHGIIQTGCRDVKPRSAEQLKDQIYNWKSVVLPRGHPFKFKNPQDYLLFKSGLKSGIAQCVLDGAIPLPSGDIRIQGSSLRTPYADDVDIAVCVTKEQYRDICAGRFQEHFFKTGQTQGKEQSEKVDALKQLTYEQMVDIANKTLAKQENGYMRSGAKGKKLTSASNYILMGKFDGKSKDFMEPLLNLTEKMKQDFPDLNIESVTVILTGGPFDLKPAMAL